MTRLCSSTSSKYFLALSTSMCLIACADSLVFLKCVRKSEPLACVPAYCEQKEEAKTGRLPWDALQQHQPSTDLRHTLADLLVLSGSRAYFTILPTGGRALAPPAVCKDVCKSEAACSADVGLCTLSQDRISAGTAVSAGSTSLSW